MASTSNSFNERMATLNQIECILVTDIRTIAQFIANRRKYLLRKRAPLDIKKNKIIGFMNYTDSEVKCVLTLTNVTTLNSAKEINKPKYLEGLGIRHIDEIGTQIHTFPSLVLWEFSLYAIISPNVSVTPKNRNPNRDLPIFWNCKNKLTLKFKNGNDPKQEIFFCYAKMEPKSHTRDMPTFTLNTSPFVIGRRNPLNNALLWPEQIKSVISAKHATITHNFGQNSTNIQRNSRVNDMTINDTDPVLAVGETAHLKNNDSIELVTDVTYTFTLMQDNPYSENVTNFLKPRHSHKNTNHKQSNYKNMNEYAQNRNSTPPPPQVRHRHRHTIHSHGNGNNNGLSAGPSPPHPSKRRMSYNHRHESPPIGKPRINRRLNFSGDVLDLTQNDDGLMYSRLPNNRNKNRNNISASPSPPMSSTPTQQIHTINNRKRRERSKDFIPETNMKESSNYNNRVQRDIIREPPLKRHRNDRNRNEEIITQTPLKMRNSYDLKQKNSIDWSSHKLLVFARYCLNPEMQCLSGAKIKPKPLPNGALLHIRKKMKGTALVFHKQVGSLLTRHAHFQSFLESILILHSGKCNLNIEYLARNHSKTDKRLGNTADMSVFPGIICDEIKIGNMGSVGYCILLIFVVNDTRVRDYGLSQLLVKLERMDLELCSNGIQMRYLYGIITDGVSEWHIIRRRNKHRGIAKDVLNDPLFSKMDTNTMNSNNEKFTQVCASLAQERWQLFKSKYERVTVSDNVLYDGYVLEYDISKSENGLKEISRNIHGLIYEQRCDFREAFELALRHNSALNRPAINPYHSVNRNAQNKACKQYLDLCDSVWNVKDDFQQSLTQDW